MESKLQRAQHYHRNQVDGISLDNIEKLADKGADVLMIEKEGPAEVFAPFAAKAGTAIVNTRGFLTEVAENISYLVSHKLGGRKIPMLHDFDSSGVALSKKVFGIVSLGIDPELLEELGLEISAVEEDYDGEKGGHWLWLKKMYPDYEHLDYLRSKRVEIDSVIAAVGAERLWQAVLSRLLKEFPTRDYNRVFVVGDIISQHTYPELMKEFDAKAVNLLRRAAASINERFRREYSNFEGFIEDVDEGEQEISKRQLAACQRDKTVKQFMARLREITDWMRAKEEEDDGG